MVIYYISTQSLLDFIPIFWSCDHMADKWYSIFPSQLCEFLSSSVNYIYVVATTSCNDPVVCLLQQSSYLAI